MGRLPNGNRKYEIKQLWDIHHEICRRLTMGQKEVDIASELNISKEMVQYTRNSPVVRQHLAGLHAERDAEAIDIAVEIRNTAPRALEVITAIMENKDSPEAVRAKCAMDILDRAGYKPVERVANFSMHVGPGDIEEIRRRADERRAMSNEFVEVVETEEETSESATA